MVSSLSGRLITGEMRLVVFRSREHIDYLGVLGFGQPE